MIKKIELQDTWGECLEKLNNLVDAVNKQQIQLNNHECRLLDLHSRVTALDDPTYHEDEDSEWYDDPKYREQPADPYTNQRKWIGKLCKFWFADAEHPTFGILDFVDAGPHPEPFHINCGESEQGWYPHCEPVKPDDDIIYKGGDNE